MNVRELAAEAIGTFWLTFGGCGSAVIAAGFPQVGIGLLGVSFASAHLAGRRKLDPRRDGAHHLDGPAGLRRQLVLQVRDPRPQRGILLF